MIEAAAESLQRVVIARLPSEPWRNGRGTTRTLAAGGASTANAWAWRVSVADITSDGPFSLFPGIDRHLALLDGNGVVLFGDTRTSHVTRIGQVTTFSGDEPLHARLIDGPVRVWNLMVERGAASGAVYEHDHATARLPHPNDLVRFVAVLAGAYRVRRPSLAELRLGAGDAVRLDAAARDVQVRPIDDHALALISDVRCAT